MTIPEIDSTLAYELRKAHDRYVHPEYYAKQDSHIVYKRGQDLRRHAAPWNGRIPTYLQHLSPPALSTEQRLSALLHMQVQLETFRLKLLKECLETAAQLKQEREAAGNEPSNTP